MLNFIIPVGAIIGGFVLLIFGADYLVRGASSLAKKLGLSPLFIGLTIVAFGTSLPEMVVNIFASFRGSNEIAIGNILGSNIFNLLFILGIAAVIYPVVVQKSTIFKEIPFSILAAAVFFILANDVMLSGLSQAIVTRADGLILISFFVIFLYYTFGIAKSSGEMSEDVKTYGVLFSLLMILGGLAGLVFGGNILVTGAISIAKILGVSESLIGLTIVAVGTSLPELATSAVAAYRKNSDIAIGNVIGSNIFNIFWILGLSAIIKPIVFFPAANIDTYVLLVGTLIVFPYLYMGRKHVLERWQGASMVGMYVVYVVYLIMRG